MNPTLTSLIDKYKSLVITTDADIDRFTNLIRTERNGKQRKDVLEEMCNQKNLMQEKRKLYFGFRVELENLIKSI